jgi:hypothetical protein
MASELQVGNNAQVGHIRSDISLPVHDTPQIDLDTGLEMRAETGSKLDAEAIRGNQSSVEKEAKLAPKKHWNAEIKKQFNSLTGTQQKAWLESARFEEKTSTKIIDGLKESYAHLDDIAGVMAPYVEEIVNVWKTTPAVYIANLIEADKEAARNPVQYILKIMGAKGLTFAALGSGVKPLMDDAENKAKLEPVLNKISELEQKLTRQEQVAQEPARDDLEYKSEVMADEIREFYNQTDSSGRELYPSWESLVPQILPMYLKGASLEEAYNSVAQDYKAKIPKNQTRVAQTPDVKDDGSSRAISERETREKERKMLVNMIDQLKQNYE